jgi:cell division protein FtsL
MTEWNVVLVIAEVIALFLLVGKPLINLNTTIATLNATVKSLKERLDSQEEKNHEAHKEFHEHFETVDIELENHEQRIRHLEATK